MAKIESSDIYAYNIMVEAKTRALIAMTRKYHPDWDNEKIVEFLKDNIDYAIKKE